MRRTDSKLRQTLSYSQKDAVASATMTAANDNFLNAFAIFLHASVAQMGMLTALPQLGGALMQMVSIFLGRLFPRRWLVCGAAMVQTVIVVAIAGLALMADRREANVIWLIVLAMLYHSCMNLIQPHWRAWMGALVPRRRRGAFFASRSRLSMIASLSIFLGGGALLTGFERLGRVGLGFAVLFTIAAFGRGLSSYFLSQMHDPEPPPAARAAGTKRTLPRLSNIRHYFSDPDFVHYSIFIAMTQGAVAISAPFFAVYMLAELKFTYLQFALNSIASLVVQFAMLGVWGRFSDRYGNRLVMLMTSAMLPILPLLWTVSPDQGYLICVQLVSGIAWSGFSLSTANYLYDIRPHRTDFAAYAAIQQALGAVAIFVGALLGGFIASQAPGLLAATSTWLPLNHWIFVVFCCSALIRAGVFIWFIPRCKEPTIRRRPELLRVVFRVARFNPISGLVLDWLTVTKKRESQQ